MDKPSFKIQKKDEVEKEFYDNGNLKMICAVDHLGRKNGDCIMYYEDGITLYSKAYYKNDLFKGEINNYFKNGKFSMKAYMKNGKLHGETELYYESGELQAIHYYGNGMMIREPKIFFR